MTNKLKIAYEIGINVMHYYIYKQVDPKTIQLLAVGSINRSYKQIETELQVRHKTEVQRNGTRYYSSVLIDKVWYRTTKRQNAYKLHRNWRDIVEFL